MRPDALELVLETLTILQDGAALPNHCRTWLRDGLRTFLVEGVEMNSALEVKPGPGQATLPNQYRAAVRNYHLAAAAEHLAAKTPWRRSMDLSAAVKRFASGAWTRMKHSSLPPSDLSPLQRELFMAFHAARGDIPTTARHLGNMIKNSETKPLILISESQEHDEPVKQKRGSIHEI